MRPMILVAALGAAIAGSAFGKLPPPSDDVKAKAVEASAKAAWSGKVGAYKLCQSMERVAQTYRSGPAGAKVQPVDTAPCSDPGPYVAAQADAKPLEAAGAHSPPAMATAPPSTQATAAEQSGGIAPKAQGTASEQTAGASPKPQGMAAEQGGASLKPQGMTAEPGGASTNSQTMAAGQGASAPPKAEKQLENAEAHSAPGMATTPPVMRGVPADQGASAPK